MHARMLAVLASLALAAPLLSVPVYAAGDGGGGDTPSPNARRARSGTRRRRNASRRSKACSTTTASTKPGRDLAMAGRYGEAITVLGLAADKTDPRILNYLGYSHRKSGRIRSGSAIIRKRCASIQTTRWCANISARPICSSATSPPPRNQLDEIEEALRHRLPRIHACCPQQIDNFMRS